MNKKMLNNYQKRIPKDKTIFPGNALAFTALKTPLDISSLKKDSFSGLVNRLLIKQFQLSWKNKDVFPERLYSAPAPKFNPKRIG